MNGHFLLSGIFLFTTLTSTFANAAAITASMSEAQLDEAAAAMLISDADLAAYLKKPEASFQRKIASAGSVDFEGTMSAKLKEIRDVELPKLKTGDDLEPLLEKLETNYDSLPNDAKLVALELLRIRPLRGIIYRMVPIVKDTKVAHSVLLTRIMRLTGRLEMFVPTIQGKVAFEYVTQPYDDVKQFKGKDGVTPEAEFQEWASTTYFSASLLSYQRLRALDVSKPLVVDNKIFYMVSDHPEAPFADELYRYNLFQESEKYLLLAAKARGLSRLKTFGAYTMDNLMELTADMGELYGVDAFFRNVEGVTNEMVAKKIRKSTYKNLFTLNKVVGKNRMKWAFKYLREMVGHLQMGWHGLKNANAKDDTSGFLNPMILNSFDRNIDRALPEWRKMVNGKTTLTSRRTSDVIEIDLPAFYENPPKDLKALLPTKFQQKSKARLETVSSSRGAIPVIVPESGYLSKTIQMNGKETVVKYRDYFVGSPEDWDGSAYVTLFPALKNGKDVARHERVLKQSWGGRLAPNFLDRLVF